MHLRFSKTHTHRHDVTRLLGVAASGWIKKHNKS